MGGFLRWGARRGPHLLQQRRADVLGDRNLGYGKPVSLRRAYPGVHRRLRARVEAVLEQRRADVQRERPVGPARPVRELGLREWLARASACPAPSKCSLPPRPAAPPAPGRAARSAPCSATRACAGNARPEPCSATGRRRRVATVPATGKTAPRARTRPAFPARAPVFAHLEPPDARTTTCRRALRRVSGARASRVSGASPAHRPGSTQCSGNAA